MNESNPQQAKDAVAHNACDDEALFDIHRLLVVVPDLLALARAVAEHFADTDAPLGHAARYCLARVEVEQTLMERKGERVTWYAEGR